jgi:hypothetical protein
MRSLYLAGLPRLQGVASVPHCQGSCLADESHPSSTYPLGTGARPNDHGQIDIINKASRAVLQRNRPGYIRRTAAAVAADSFFSTVDCQSFNHFFRASTAKRRPALRLRRVNTARCFLSQMLRLRRLAVEVRFVYHRSAFHRIVTAQFHGQKKAGGHTEAYTAPQEGESVVPLRHSVNKKRVHVSTSITKLVQFRSVRRERLGLDSVPMGRNPFTVTYCTP